MAKIRTYSEMLKYQTFEERLEYLMLEDHVGRITFGHDRYINQKFYTSRQWRDIRQFVIVRDNGCDLGILDYEIHNSPLIHHINPMVIDDILHGEEWILDPEYLITTTHDTHNAIHYGRQDLTPKAVVERTPGDTQLW